MVQTGFTIGWYMLIVAITSMILGVGHLLYLFVLRELGSPLKTVIRTYDAMCTWFSVFLVALVNAVGALMTFSDETRGAVGAAWLLFTVAGILLVSEKRHTIKRLLNI